MKLSPFLTLALGLSLSWGSGAAQTLIDTSAAVGVANTLNSVGTGSSAGVLPQVRERLSDIFAPVQDAASQATAGQATSGTPAPTQATPGQAPAALTAPAGAQGSVGASAVDAPPLTAEQLGVLQSAYTTLERGDAAAAAQQFKRLISENYRHPEAHFGLALALIAQGQTSAAKFELGQLAELAPQRFEGPYNLGVLAVKEGQYAQALTLFGQAATLVRASGGPDVQLYVLDALAAEQARAGDYAALRQTLGDMAALSPSDASIKLRLAQAQALTGEGVAALPSAYDALNSPGTRAGAAALLADIYEAQGLTERGLSEVDAALQKASSDAERGPLLVRRARLLSALGQGAEAARAAEESVRLDPSDSAYALLGDLRRQGGDLAGALRAYRQAALLKPDNAAYRAELAALRLSLGSYADARRDADMTLKMDSAPAAARARAQLVLGLLDYRSGRYSSASAALSASATALPAAETFLWLGLSEYKQKNYAEAATALSESVRLSPTAVARRNLGSALLAGGRAPEAEALLLGLVTEAPSDAQAWYLLGLARRASGKAAEARAAFKSAAALGSAAARGALQ